MLALAQMLHYSTGRHGVARAVNDRVRLSLAQPDWWALRENEVGRGLHKVVATFTRLRLVNFVAGKAKAPTSPSSLRFQLRSRTANVLTM